MKPQGKLAELVEGGQEALDNLIAPPLPHPFEGQPWFRGVHPATGSPDKEVRDLPEPVLNAVYANVAVINGPKGSGMQWKSKRRKPEEFRDPDNLEEYEVLDPWGDLHVVFKMSEKALQKNIQKYAERVREEIAKGRAEAAEWFAKRVAGIVHETLMTGVWSCQ